MTIDYEQREVLLTLLEFLEEGLEDAHYEDGSELEVVIYPAEILGELLEEVRTNLL